MQKRVLAILLVSILAGSALSGCGKSETAEKADAASGESDSQKASNVLEATPEQYSFPLTEEQITLTYSSCESWSPEYSLADNREIFQEIEKKTGVKIDWEVVAGSDYDTVLKTKIASGDIPDITGVGASVNPIQLYENGLTIDHGEYISKYAPNIIKLINENEYVKAMMMGPDGKPYTATAEVQYRTANVKGIFYRKDWQKKLNIADPVTKEDYFNMFKAFAEKDPNGNGENDEVPLSIKVFEGFGPLASAFDLDFQVSAGDNLGFTAVNGDVEFHFISPEFKEFLAYLKSYYDAGILPKEVFTKDDSVEKTLLANNRLGAFSNGLGQCDTYDKVLLKPGYIDEITPEKGFNWLPPIANEANERNSPAMLYVTPNSFVVSSKCKNPEVAIKWLDYVWASQEGRNYTTLGIEGKSYNMVDGKPEFTDYILKNPDGLGVHPALRSLGAFTPWLAHWSDEAFAAQWANNEKLTEVIKNAKPTMTRKPFPKILGTTEETSEVASKLVDITTYRDEMILKFITGQESLDKFDEYVKTIKDYGIDEVIAIKQSQYDRVMG